ncbi:MAG: branched-chain amino acid transport system permease protein [Actinomycetota bacterium]|jgi:branched-chain amino acid transport system permease protein
MSTEVHPDSVEEVVEEEAREAEALAQQTREAAMWRPSTGGVLARAGVLAALLLLVLAMPHLVPSVYTNLVARAAVYGIVALSMNVLVGYAGQVSLGHSAFFGVGAFGSAYALTKMEIPFLAALVVAALTGAVGALVIGAIALRLQGLYLAIVTIAYAYFAQEAIFNVRSLTGGGAGQPAPRPSFLTSDVRYAYFCIAVLAIALAFDWRLTASKGGRAIQALRDDERVAASWGINITSYKLLAFLVSGVLAGVAGALFASTEGVATPLDFPFSLGLTFLVMTVVGGAGSRWGVVQGGVLFALLPTLLERAHENFHLWPFTAIDATTEPAIGALLLLVTLIFYPGGIAQQQRHLLSWLSFRRWSDARESGGIIQGGMGARP